MIYEIGLKHVKQFLFYYCFLNQNNVPIPILWSAENLSFILRMLLCKSDIKLAMQIKKSFCLFVTLGWLTSFLASRCILRAAVHCYRQRVPGNQVLRYTFPIKTPPFSTFCQILALCVEWRNSTSRSRYQSEEMKIVNF